MRINLKFPVLKVFLGAEREGSVALGQTGCCSALVTLAPCRRISDPEVAVYQNGAENVATAEVFFS